MSKARKSTVTLLPPEGERTAGRIRAELAKVTA